MMEENPRFFQPTAPLRAGTSHEPRAQDRHKGTHPDLPTDRLKAINSLLKRMPRPSTHPSKISVVGGLGNKMKNSNTSSSNRQPAQAAPKVDQRGGGRSGAKAFALSPSKSEFEPCSYDKHKMEVQGQWVKPASDFSRPTSREERATALKTYASHQTDLNYFVLGDGKDSGDFDPRRHRAKPEYRIGGLAFSSYTSRDQRAKSDRATLQAEREAIAIREYEEWKKKEEAEEEAAASGDDDQPSPTCKKAKSGHDVLSSADLGLDDETMAKNQQRVNPYHDAGADPATVARRAKEQQLLKDRPSSAPHVRQVPNFERSMQTTVSKLTQVGRDEAVLMGTASSQSAMLETAGQRWSPFTLGPYNVKTGTHDASKGYRTSAQGRPFSTMAGHDGYRSEIQRQKQKTHQELVEENSGVEFDPTDGPGGKRPASAMSYGGRRSALGFRAKDEGLKYTAVDPNPKSVPVFSKTCGKDAPLTGNAAPKGGSRGGVDLGINVTFDSQEGHQPCIDISKSALRPEPRKNAYSTNMTLFPKYSVVDLGVKSPRLGPDRRHRTPPSGHRGGTRPLSAPSSGRPGDGMEARAVSASSRATPGGPPTHPNAPGGVGRIRPQSAQGQAVPRGMGGRRVSATSSGSGSNAGAANKRAGHGGGAARTGQPEHGDRMNGYRNDDLVHPRITRRIVL